MASGAVPMYVPSDAIWHAIDDSPLRSCPTLPKSPRSYPCRYRQKSNHSSSSTTKPIRMSFAISALYFFTWTESATLITLGSILPSRECMTVSRTLHERQTVQQSRLIESLHSRTTLTPWCTYFSRRRNGLKSIARSFKNSIRNLCYRAFIHVNSPSYADFLWCLAEGWI